MRTATVNQQPKTTFVNYEIKEGLKVSDGTGGIAKVVFEDLLSKCYYPHPAYTATINGKPVVTLDPLDPIAKTYRNFMGILILVGTKKLIFEKEDNRIKITADEKQYYVDVGNPDPNPSDRAIAYHGDNDPRKQQYENALKKIQTFTTDFPDFKNGPTAVYNHLGVAVFGWDNKINSYGLCWASSSQEKVSQIKCHTLAIRGRTEKDPHYDTKPHTWAATRDDSVKFEVFNHHRYVLNGAPAEPIHIPLNQEPQE